MARRLRMSLLPVALVLGLFAYVSHPHSPAVFIGVPLAYLIIGGGLAELALLLVRRTRAKMPS
jgi:hypothetical protein